MNKTERIRQVKRLLRDFDADPQQVAALAAEPLPEIAALLNQYQAAKAAEEARLLVMSRYEREYWQQGLLYLAGLDEVGRGPLAGPVTVAAVMLPPNCRLWGVDDSKRLTPAKRAALELQIKQKALCWAVASVNHRDIDAINILEAVKLAMHKAVRRLQFQPELLLIDAIPLQSEIAVLPIIKGDSQSISIAAASILAKNHRDRVMERFDALYPQYGFAAHKGYPTAAHRQAVLEYGFSPIHRRSFRVR